MVLRFLKSSLKQTGMLRKVINNCVGSHHKRIVIIASDDSVNRQTEDRTEKSIEFLQKLSKFNKTDSQTTKTILKYNKGRLSKNDEKMEPVDNSTVFSNTDFDKFEDEYDFFS
ncbi:uncharacterized protein LOC134725541 isoform X2 [Mytilus trossulus]|uniref:uncharacterized protein LOC134725541 isoform X2 n=1 Tax=Mytilus trossulus TaxID=6551 RepID=UPI003007C987